ncbi:phage major capsid protein [Streptomyces hirsutus]|uniref:phage major capsid protein n=1 Tax=Streptomyces hirsutus TaxID=35620 RepID=UPI0033DF3F31
MPVAQIPRAEELRERSPGQTIGQQCDAIRQAVSDRMDAMQAVRDASEAAGRDTLLASEQRTFDAHDDEVRRLGLLLRRLENSPEGRQVDRSQIITTGERSGGDGRDELPLLTRERSFADWVTRHGRVRDEDHGVRLGALLRTWVTGRRDHLNDAELRAMSEGTATAGGHLVPTPTAAQLIDRARNVARVFQAGAVTVPMDSQTLKVPRLTGSSAPAWRSENAAVAEGDLTLDAVTLTAKSMAFLVKMSREVVEDSSPNVVGVVEGDLHAQVALELDRVALRGTGTAPEPRGVLNQTGVTITAHGTDGSSLTNYDFHLDAVGAVRNANFEPTAHIQAPRTSTSLSKLKEATTNAYLAPPANMLPMLPTKQVPTNLTVGASADCSEIYTGQWDQLYFGLRTGPMVLQLVERYADVGQIAMLIWVRGDIALAHGEAFAVDTGVRA